MVTNNLKLSHSDKENNKLSYRGEPMNSDKNCTNDSEIWDIIWWKKINLIGILKVNENRLVEILFHRQVQTIK